MTDLGDDEGGAPPPLDPRRPKYKAHSMDAVLVRRVVDASANGDVAKLLDLVEGAPDLDLDEPIDLGRDFTPLMLACENVDAVELIRELVEEMGVDVNNAWSERKLTPLHVACKARNAEAVEILLDAGASVSPKDLVGRTALHWACIGCPLRTIKSIARRGGVELINAADLSGYTALMVASEHGRPEVVHFLVAAGGDTTAANKLGHVSAELADWYGHAKVLDHLDPRWQMNANGAAMRVVGPADVYMSFGAAGAMTGRAFRERRIFPGVDRKPKSASGTASRDRDDEDDAGPSSSSSSSSSSSAAAAAAAPAPADDKA